MFVLSFGGLFGFLGSFLPCKGRVCFKLLLSSLGLKCNSGHAFSVFSHVSSCFCWLICYVGDVFLMYFIFCIFFTHDNISKNRVCMLLSSKSKKTQNSYVYSFRVKETRLYIVLWKPRKQMYQCIFPQNTEDYRKMNKILSNFCTLKTRVLGAQSNGSLL